MSARLVWSALAEGDILDAYLHLGLDSPDAAERLLDALNEAVTFILENPAAGSPRASSSARTQGTRFWALRAFPNYLVFYKADARGAVEIVRFLHGARNLSRLLGEDPE
jgi:toxin ParE1/3/4